MLLARRFETRRRVGAGGLAEVFAARDRATDTEVAVKLLHAHLAQDAAACERFRRELAALLREHAGNVAAVARVLGKARMQVHRWVRRFDLSLADYR